jgi:hypothetical protein
VYGLTEFRIQNTDRKDAMIDLQGDHISCDGEDRNVHIFLALSILVRWTLIENGEISQEESDPVMQCSIDLQRQEMSRLAKM